jgi:isopentenyl diphosphate isomerase/L-lactate dehydrogenase-like FMN-dependent dehydrogenase
MPSRLSSSQVLNIEDLRRLAKRRVPRAVFDYIDGGAETEWTMRENARAFGEFTWLPRCAVNTPTSDLNVRVLGVQQDLPVLLAPVGSSRLFYPRGEMLAAQAAGESGIPYILSSFSGCRLEDVKAATRGTAWYQLYLAGPREVAISAIERARQAGYSALVVTVDTAVAGMRERDFRNGVKELAGRSLFAKLPYVLNIVTHPRWLVGFLGDGGLMKFPNIVLPGIGPMPYADVGKALEQAAVTWDDLTWIREVWKGPIVIKGIHTADDAKRAVDAGANALVVSNHGGRQLDGVAPTLHVLPRVVAAVGNHIEVLFDGGIRRGGDIAKALCFGARAVLVGRAYAYGLAAAGGVGVARAIEILRTDLIRTMKLLGCGSVAQLDQSYLEASSTRT